MEDEKIIKNMPDPVTILGTETILNQMKNSICKIKINNTNGTGFFCTINYKNRKINFLMTNYHVLDENYYAENNELNLFINDDKDVKILNLKIKRKTYFNKKYDLTMIELKEDDNINHFLELDDNLFKNEIKAFYKDISIYVIQYPLGNNATVSYGLSNGINNYEINHTCSTEHGSSGSPILNLSNHKVIGIHKQKSKNFNYNIGTCLQFPLNNFCEKNEINNNIIKGGNKDNNKNYNDILNKYEKEEKIRKKFNEIIRILNDTIPDLKYQIGPGPKMNIVFSEVFRRVKNILTLNYGTTIDQMLIIYLRIIDKEYLYNENYRICFIFNAKKIEFGDKTPIEIFFKYCFVPKITVNIPEDGTHPEIYHYIKREDLFRNRCHRLISIIMDILGFYHEYNYYYEDNADITIKFNNNGKIFEIKMPNDFMVAELIEEYWSRTRTIYCTFIFNNEILSPMDTSILSEAGLRNNSEIIVK